jgi:hypothetical protein
MMPGFAMISVIEPEGGNAGSNIVFVSASVYKGKLPGYIPSWWFQKETRRCMVSQCGAGGLIDALKLVVKILPSSSFRICCEHFSETGEEFCRIQERS